MDCVAIIPARFGSTRFPGKPLATLQGRPLIEHVVARCSQVAGIDRVVVATDDQRIVDTLDGSAADVMLTSADFESGTDRVAHVAEQLDADIVLNVQGDEPLIDAVELSAALATFRHSGADYGTLRAPLVDAADLVDPNTVKVAVDTNGVALYFSRAPIPYPRALQRPSDSGPERGAETPWLPLEGPIPEGLHWIHVGVYLCRTPALLRWARMPRSPLEIAENLEQLRVLEAGGRMHTYEVSEALPGVDTPADLERVRQALGDKSIDDNEP